MPKMSPLARVLIRREELDAPSPILTDPYASLYCTQCPPDGYCEHCGSYDPPPVSLETLELIAAASRPRNLAVPVLRNRKPLES